MTALSQSLRAARNRGIVPVIPDFKMISPECGPLFSGRDPVEWACRMESLGAPALSVVTEETEFGGSLSLLRRIASAVNIPVLRWRNGWAPGWWASTTATSWRWKRMAAR